MLNIISDINDISKKLNNEACDLMVKASWFKKISNDIGCFGISFDVNFLSMEHERVDEIFEWYLNKSKPVPIFY